jgi:ribonuclease J
VTETLRVVPLGGLGEVGMNCLAFERGADIVVVDCGVMFPGEDVGVDIIHPDLGWLVENRDRLRGVVLTHGHEDHIGAVPFLLRAVDVPVYGPRYALALVEERLRQHQTLARPELHRVAPGDALGLGSFVVRPIRVTHSIADSTALVVETPEHVVVHSGDFRIDDDPVDGEPMEVERLRGYGDRGVDLLLSDSTNVERPGRGGSEQSVAAAIEDAARHVEGAVFVALFSSNTPRLQLVLDVAAHLGRQPVLVGRSVHTHVRVASELGYLRDGSAAVLPLDRAAALPRHGALYIVTGTQGEPRSALGRLAAGNIRGLDVGAGDLVVISGRFIPGNDLDIYRVVSGLTRRGARVIHSRAEPAVHVSGHAHRDEQRAMIDLLRPKAFVPIHGTYHHLAGHADLARQAGVRDVMVVEDGESFLLGPGGLVRGGLVSTGRVHVDGAMGVSEDVLQDRRSLRGGIAVVVVAMDDGRLVATPKIVARGVGDEDAFPALWKRGAEAVEDAVLASRESVRRDSASLRDVAARALSRYVARALDRHPLTLAVVVDVGADEQGPDLSGLYD